MDSRDMLYCRCGYSCGVKSALDKHIHRFENTFEQEKHGRAAKLGILNTNPGMLSLDADVADTSLVHVRHSTHTLPNEPEEPSPAESPSVEHSLALSFASPTASSSSLSSPTHCFPMMAGSPVSPITGKTSVRLLLVRHAQSANKDKRPGERSVSDPDLSDLGYEQADALGERLFHEFSHTRRGDVIFASSPMRRCLLTIQPGVGLLQLSPEYCFCHGACYEYGCAGNGFRGSSVPEIVKEFPEFRPIGFTDQGHWDYMGSNDKENEKECRARGIRIVQWLHAEAAIARATSGGTVRTIVLSTHQTIADLLCHVFVGGDAEAWTYGEISHRLQNASITEVWLHPDGKATLGRRNDGAHLIRIGVSRSNSLSGSMRTSNSLRRHSG